MTSTIENWTKATGGLPWGVHKVFKDVLVLAAEGKTTLIYGADYREGSPCLVNTAGAMLTVGGGEGIPTAHFREVVRLFDDLNDQFFAAQVNTQHGYVSPLAAEFLVRHYAEDCGKPPVDSPVENLPYYEASDEEIAAEMVSLFTMPCSPVDPDVGVIDHVMSQEGLHSVMRTYSDSDE